MDDLAPTALTPVDVVRLMVPPYATHLELVRAATAHAATYAGLEFEDRDDLCLAVDELCQLVLAATDFAIMIVLTVQPVGVLARVVARRRDHSKVDEASGLTAAVLARAADYFSLEPSDDVVEGVVVKCRTRTPRS